MDRSDGQSYLPSRCVDINFAEKKTNTHRTTYIRNMPCQSSSSDNEPTGRIYSLLQNQRLNPTEWNERPHRNVLGFVPSDLSRSEEDQGHPVRPRFSSPSHIPVTTTTTNIHHHHRTVYLISILDEALDLCSSIDFEMNRSSSMEPSDTDHGTTERD